MLLHVIFSSKVNNAVLPQQVVPNMRRNHGPIQQWYADMGSGRSGHRPHLRAVAMVGSSVGIASLCVGFFFSQLRGRHVGTLGLAALHWASLVAALRFPFVVEGCFGFSSFDFEGSISLGVFATS